MEKIKIHTVRSPFMSRAGQFEEGRTLVIGLAVNALAGTDTYRCYLGKNKKCYYQIDCKEGLVLADKYGSVWTNKTGKKVAILPLKDFERVEVPQKEVKKKVVPEPISNPSLF